jgi:hypothetical protein
VIKKLLGAALALALIIAGGYFLGPSLWNDFQHRNDEFAAATDVELKKGSCRTKLFVVNFCDMELAGAGLPDGERHNVYLTVLNERDSLSVLRSKTDPSYVTTDFGMEALWYRAGTFVVGMGLLLAWFFGAIRSKSDEAA